MKTLLLAARDAALFTAALATFCGAVVGALATVILFVQDGNPAGAIAVLIAFIFAIFTVVALFDRLR